MTEMLLCVENDWGCFFAVASMVDIATIALFVFACAWM